MDLMYFPVTWRIQLSAPKTWLTNETSTRYSGWNQSNAFDNAFNQTTFKGASKSYNSNNQLTTGSMTYDGNGNPTTYKGETWTYDVENRVTAIGTNITCGYRADNLRAWKQGSTGGKTYFLYDGGTPIIEMDSSGNVANINVFAPDGLVARKEGSTWTYYTFDQQGNVAQRLNSSQVVQTSRVFDAWGDGAETTTPRSYDCWNYNGKWGYYYDRETGLYYCQNRMYDSTTGRWINRDPIGYAGGINLYGYCSDGPVGRIDPSGLDWHDPGVVYVVPGFKGKPWVSGEQGINDPTAFVRVPSGYQSSPTMDADILVVHLPNGKQRRYFLMGWGKLRPGDHPENYVVGANGEVYGSNVWEITDSGCELVAWGTFLKNVTPDGLGGYENRKDYYDWYNDVFQAKKHPILPKS